MADHLEITVITTKETLMSNLSNTQFEHAADIEEKQRRRFRRKHESGYSGAGFWYSNYPYMTGAMGTGGMATENHPEPDNEGQETASEHGAEAMGAATNGVTDTAMPAPTSDGGGIGGTMTSAVAM